MSQDSTRCQQIWLLTSKGHVGTHSQHSKFNMFHLQILVLLTGPTSQLQKAYNNWQLNQEKPKCWHCQGEYYKKDCPTASKPKFPPKYKSTKEKQCNLIKTFHKKFQDRRQINELCTPASYSSEEFNNFISEFKNIMLEDLDDSSA